MGRVTIKDIAKKLNINASTVSRALRDHVDVSEEMKVKVKKLAEKMGYHPNQMAISLRNGHSKTIGLIIPEISMFFFPSIIKAVEEATHQRGYNLLVLHSNDSVQREIENAAICAFNGVEGVLVSLTKQSLDIEHFSDLEYAGIPVVYFDKVLQATVAHKIEVDGKKAARIAMAQLLQRYPSAQRICGIFGDMRLFITQERIEGFIAALQEQGLRHQLDNIVFANSSDEARQAMLLLYEQQPAPDLLFAMSDEILAGMLQAVGDLQLKVGQDVHIVAMSDGYLPNLVFPPIPYIETSGYQLGKSAIGLLFELIDGKQIVPTSAFIDTPFVH